MRSAAILALVAVSVPGLPPAALGAQDVDPRDRELRRLEFEGNESFSAKELGAVIETRPTTCRSFLLQPICWFTNWGFAVRRSYLEEDELPADLLRLRVFYRLRGYYEAAVDTTVVREEETAEVTLGIQEGPVTRIDSLRITGLEGVMDTASLREEMDLAPGDPFSRVKLNDGSGLIVERLQNRGHIDAEVLQDLFVPTGMGAIVELGVAPGTRFRIGEIQIEGGGEIGEGTIRDFLAFEPGEYYNQAEVLESQRNLFSLDAIRFASIGRTGDRVPGDSTLDLAVRITPAPTRAARGGGGWSTNRCFQTEARLTHRNFFGGARTLEITARLSNLFAQVFDGNFPCADVGQDPVFHQLNYLLQIEFQQPHFFSPRNAFRARLFGERESVPDVFIREGVGGQLALTRRLRPSMTATLSFRPEYTGFDKNSADIFFCVNFGFCQREDIELISQKAWLAPITLSWAYNRTDNTLAPTRGYYLQADTELAERFTGSQYTYVRFGAQAAEFLTLSPGLVLAGRVRGGVVAPTRGLVLADTANEIVNPGKRFFAGGSQSVRGFGQNLLGPTVLVLDSLRTCPDIDLQECVLRTARTDPGEFLQRPVGGNASFELSLELRRRLGTAWGLVGFLDVGQVWESIRSRRAPVLTPGVGVRWFSPVGPFRIDIGYNPIGSQLLPVVVSTPDGDLIELENSVLYNPFTFDDPSRLTEVWRRLRIHFSIGEAF